MMWTILKIGYVKILVLIFLFCYKGYCEDLIILKSNKEVRGKIIEKTGDYVKIDFCGLELKYYNDQIKEIKKIKDKEDEIELLDKEFKDSIFKYSFRYPKNWRLLNPDELKSVMLIGIAPLDNPYISIQIQVKELSESDIKDKDKLIDLLKNYTKPSEYLNFEFIRPVNFKNISGYLARYIYNTNEIVDNKDLNILLPVKITFDYYFFSPVFVSYGRDKRIFLIELMYLEFKEICTEDVEKIEKVDKINSYFRDINKKIEFNYLEAEEIIKSFSF